MNVVKKWEKLKEKYFKEEKQNRLNDDWYEEIRREFDSLEITKPKITITDIGDIENEPVQAFICPDDFWTSTVIYIIRSDEKIEMYKEKLEETTCEYYTHISFYDTVTGYNLSDLLSFTIQEYKIPIVAYFYPQKTNIFDMERSKERRYEKRDDKNIHSKNR